MDQLVSNFILCKKIAIIGCSANSRKFGNIACIELKKKGYEPFVIHPTAKEIDGHSCYPNLQMLPAAVDGIFISVHPDKVNPLLEEAAQLGNKPIWLQQGSCSKEAKQTIARLGLSVVTDKCILMYAPPVQSIHRFHRGINRFFGKL